MKKTVTKTHDEMILDIMKTLLKADDITLKSLYNRFFVAVDVEIEESGMFSVSNKSGIRNISIADNVRVGD